MNIINDPQDSYVKLVNEGEEEKTDSEKIESRKLLREYALITLFLALFLLGFFFAKFLCGFGIPDDCHNTWGDWLIWHELWNLMTWGFIAIWFMDVRRENRQHHFLSWRRWYFYVVFMGAIPIFGLLADKFHSSLSSGLNFSSGKIYIICLILVNIVIIWHYIHAYRIWSKLRFFLYMGRTLLAVLFYVIFFLFQIKDVMNKETDETVHVHHWFIGWILSMWAVHNHFISDVFLAITLAIFVQGIAAYDVADLVEGTHCYKFANHLVSEFQCTAKNNLVAATVCLTAGAVRCTYKF